MLLENNTIHVWTSTLSLSEEEAAPLLRILSLEERQQAARFRFTIHRLRYIAAHAILRKILAQYTNESPENIQFGYTDKEKPFLQTAREPRIQFNLSHSDNMALYAMGVTHPLGIDIEKVKDKYSDGVSDRFFSSSEREALARLSGTEKKISFCRVWTRKEAIIKATGKGLAQPLSTFSVSVEPISEIIEIENQPWQLIPIKVNDDFQASLACHPSIKTITYYSTQPR